MSRFTTYAIKEITSSFLFLVILLTGILWMGQGLRHIDLVTSENVSLLSYISYVILLLPKITLLTVPISIFLAILFNVNRFKNDSELIIFWASGKSDSEILLKPVIIFTSFVCLLMLLMSIFVTPMSLNEIRHKIIDIRSSGIHSSLLKEKKFISPVDTLTIFLQERNGNEINGLLSHDLKQYNRPQTYIAQNGKLISDENRKILRLFNGNIQIFDKSQSKISEIAFDTYDLDLMPYSKEENKHIYSDELLTFEIMRNLKGKVIYEFNKYEKEQFAELHTRFANPIYIFFFAILPLLIIRFAKRPDESWFIAMSLVSFIAFIVQILQITLSNLLVEYSQLVSLVYFFPIIIFLFSEYITSQLIKTVGTSNGVSSSTSASLALSNKERSVSL